MLLNIVGFFLVLGIIIFLHELGHYVAARLAGVKVEEFGLGFPPRLVKLLRFQGTDFTLNWIPFGGFARLKGMDDDDDGSDTYAGASGWRKAGILLAGPAMNLLLALSCFALTYRVGVPVNTGWPELSEVEEQSLAQEVGLMPGDRLIAVNGLPADVTPPGWPVTLRNPRRAEANRTVDVYRPAAGRMQLSVPPEVSVYDLLRDTDYELVFLTEIGSVEEDSPADNAGLQAGDRVYSLDGESVSLLPAQLVVITRRNLGAPTQLEVWRPGYGPVKTTVTPRAEPPAGQGPLGISIHVVSDIGYVRGPRVLLLGLADTMFYIQGLAALPALLLRGEAPPEEAALIGPVGIAGLMGDALAVTTNTGLWLPVLRLSGAVSAALAVSNLLPIPGLDGGRLLFVLVEAVRRRPIRQTQQRLVNYFGMALLLFLMVFITIQDVTVPREGIDWYALLGR